MWVYVLLSHAFYSDSHAFLYLSLSQVVALICLIIASVTLDDLDGGSGGLVDRTNAACGFIVFLAIMVMLIEGIIIALRFLNFDIVNKFIFIFHIAVCIANCFLLPPLYMHIHNNYWLRGYSSTTT